MDIKLKLDFRIDPLKINLVHGDRSVLLGSCFSNEIGTCFSGNGFDVLSNPFGTVFHPEPISRMIAETISGKAEENVFQRNDLFFSWDAAGTVFSFSETELEAILKSKREKLLDYLEGSKYLFVTFGSAFGYEENQSREIVANCHRMPGSYFSKNLTDLDLLVTSWSRTLDLLRMLNPELQVVFTVSPVRHVKDGLVENNRSKSRLFELIGALEHFPNVHYFPSYEIVVDELRDYRFYKTDGIHPNEQAIRYVWDRLKEALFNPETHAICEEVMQLQRLQQHTMLYKDSKEALQFEENNARRISDFLVRHPEVSGYKKS